MRDCYGPISNQHLLASDTDGRDVAGAGNRAAALGCAGILVMTMLAGSCGEGPQSMDPTDAGPDFAVRGIATGVLGPVALELRRGSDVESLTVIEEGTFAFVTRLADGDSYTVAFVDPDMPCNLRNQTGVIAGADTAVELSCTGPALASVVVSGIAPPTVTLVPGMTDYAVDLSLLQQSVTLTATVAMAGNTLAIAGTLVDSGTPSPEIPLGLGDNVVDIVVENALGWKRTYRLTVRRAAQLAQYAYGKASNTDAGDNFGISVALSGDTLAVGAWGEDSASRGVGGNQTDNSARNSGAVYVFRRRGTAWQQEAYLKASNTGIGDSFGNSVALSGDTLAIGTYLEGSASEGVGGNQDDDSAPFSGAVYVFRRRGTTWQQETYLKASNTGANDQFGVSVALSGDTLAVGAWREDSASEGVGSNQDDNSASDSGAVYVFRRTDTSWQQEAYLKASNTGSEDLFGVSVALAGDTLAVGAHGEDSASQGVGGNQDDNGASDSGAVYMFRRTGTSWQQETYLKASNTGTYDFFGFSVALAGDTLAVGAHGEDSASQDVGGNQDDNGAQDSGAVYMFRRASTSWQQEAYLKASNTGADDEFGRSVALSGDTLAAGAYGEASTSQGVGGNQDDNGASNSGAVYVFRRTGTAWQQETYLKASNAGVLDQFGINVALSGDTLAVGARGEGSTSQGVGGNQADDSAGASGAVYIFH